MSHTPGPWKFDADDMQVAAGTRNICEINEYAFECGANARLIAASPDMLAALHEAKDEIEAQMPDEFAKHAIEPCCCSWHDTLDVIRTAIAKAEGRS